MTTKQAKPATPLPWICPGSDGGEFVVCSDGSKGKRRTIAHAYEPTNAAYIVHACNSLPRLLAERAECIAALRLGRGAEDHLKRQALLRRIEGAE